MRQAQKSAGATNESIHRNWKPLKVRKDVLSTTISQTSTLNCVNYVYGPSNRSKGFSYTRRMHAGYLIATILRHDRKTASYKIALIRSLNDLALGYAHLAGGSTGIAVPLRALAQFWVAYYWPFVLGNQPIQQGIHPANKQDISFRPALTHLRQLWERVLGAQSLASDRWKAVRNDCDG